MSKAFQIASACFVFLIGASAARGQAGKTPAPARTFAISVAAAAPAEDTAPPAPTNLTFVGGGSTEIDLSWTAPTGNSSVSGYKIYNCTDDACKAKTAVNGGEISSINIYSVTKLNAKKEYYFCVVSVDADGTESDISNVLTVQTGSADSGLGCMLIPARRGCMDFGSPTVGRFTKIYSNINSFYQTSGSYSFFNQIKSIYNQASGSATVGANLASLNFSNAMQVAVGTNVQAGSSGATNVSSGTVPTLSASGAAQATQNVVYGGTFVVSEMYPLLATGASKWGSSGNLGVIIDAIAKEGADVQNFKSGTNVSATSPPFHGSVHIEGYLQTNSINLSPNSQHFAGSVFVGGSYGYDYMSHVYARDYGFQDVGNGIGQVSLGILINAVANITVSRAFGPSQTYMDSTTMAQTKVNNFKAWSFGIAYQSAPSTK